jgi:hypothetical protein
MSGLSGLIGGGWGRLPAGFTGSVGGAARTAGALGLAGGLGAGLGMLGYEGIRAVAPENASFKQQSSAQGMRNFGALMGIGWDTVGAMILGENTPQAAQRRNEDWALWAQGTSREELEAQQKERPISDQVKELRRRLAEETGGRMSDTEAGNVILAMADQLGLSAKDIKPGSPHWQTLKRMANMGLDSGLGAADVAGFISNTGKMAGYLPGSMAAMPAVDYVSRASTAAMPRPGKRRSKRFNPSWSSLV